MVANTSYHPIDCGFHDILLDRATRQAYCKIFYYTPLREFTKANAVIKDVYTQDQEEFMKLATGEIIRLDRIIVVDEYVAPGYPDFLDFTCDC